MVDCVIGGSPCQDLSLAGKRAGLAGARSGLYIEQIRIIKEMRQQDVLRGRTDVDVRPRYMVWENVPGAFSTNKGQDFAAVLEEAIRVAEPEAPNVDVPEKGWPTSGCFYDEMGKWSVAWRVLDAQFWGTSDKPLPQRRRRIALVADFGGLSAPEILFVRESVSGDIEPGKPKGKEAAGDAGNSAGGAIGCDIYNGALSGDKAVSLTTAANATGTGPTVIGIDQQGGKGGANFAVDVAPPMMSDSHGTPHAVCYSVDQGGGKSGAHSYEGVSPTLTCTHGGEPAVAYSIYNHPADSRVDIDESGRVQTLTSRMGTGGGNVPMVMEPILLESNQDHATVQTNGISTTLPAAMGMGGGYIPMVTQPTANGNGVVRVQYPQEIHDFVAENNSDAPHQQDMLQTADGIARTIAPGTHAAGSHLTKTIIRIGNRYTVRRLTPLECERLQGYPDGWTLLPKIDDMTVAEYEFWKSVILEREKREGRARENENGVLEIWKFVDGEDEDEGEWVNTHKPYKHNTKDQMIGWYNRMVSADSSRYKALGNSIALPPWKWVLKRLCACYERDATMASLFDGIGVFPLIWEQLNGKGSCLWASEIEEFPMAVTKVRFGE